MMLPPSLRPPSSLLPPSFLPRPPDSLLLSPSSFLPPPFSLLCLFFARVAFLGMCSVGLRFSCLWWDARVPFIVRVCYLCVFCCVSLLFFYVFVILVILFVSSFLCCSD